MRMQIIFGLFCILSAFVSAADHREAPREWREAHFTTKGIAVLVMSDTVHGAIVFEEEPRRREVHITGSVTGLAPNTQHGFHVHTFGDMSDGCTSAAAHFNPLREDHGAPVDHIRHFGDLGNIQSDAQGVAQLNITDRIVTLLGPGSVVGRMVIVHEKMDDLGKGGNPESKTTGNAGARIACGIIGLANSTTTIDDDGTNSANTLLFSKGFGFVPVIFVILNLFLLF